MKLNIRMARQALLGQLCCTALLMQPVMVSTPAIAKSQTNTSAVVEESINGKTFCVTKAVIKAKPETVWQVLTDYGNAPRVFPMVKKCHVMEDRGATKILKHQVSPSGLCGTFEYVIELKENAPKSLEWHRLSGSFKEVDGFWKLEPLDGGHSTLVTYSAYVNGGLFIPQGLIRRQFRTDMPQVMTSLKGQAEAPTQIAGRPTAAHAQ